LITLRQRDNADVAMATQIHERITSTSSASTGEDVVCAGNSSSALISELTELRSEFFASALRCYSNEGSKIAVQRKPGTGSASRLAAFARLKKSTPSTCEKEINLNAAAAIEEATCKVSSSLNVLIINNDTHIHLPLVMQRW
jgi:hypothetical protein